MIDTERVRLDQKSAFQIFNTLERQATQAVHFDEMHVAASLTNTLFYVSAQTPEFWKDYNELSEEWYRDYEDTQFEEEAVAQAMHRLFHWSVENNHPVREWFEDAQEALRQEREGSE